MTELEVIIDERDKFKCLYEMCRDDRKKLDDKLKRYEAALEKVSEDLQKPHTSIGALICFILVDIEIALKDKES